MIINIQALRAFAAIIVVLFHAHFAVEHQNFEWSAWDILTLNVRKWGSFGVDLFFIISGYLMFMINDKKPRSPCAFMLNRIERIVPMYWFLTLSLFMIYHLIPAFFSDMEYGFGKLISSLSFVSMHFHYDFPALYVGWTLEYEMTFYALFALTLCMTMTQYKRWCVLTFIMIVCVVFGLYRSVALEFILGGAIFIGMQWGRTKFSWYQKHVYWLLFLLSFCFVMIVPKPNDAWRFMIWGIPAAIMFISILLVNDLKSKVLQQLGNASYSIYLMQVPMLPLGIKAFAQWMPNTDGLIVFLVLTILSILAGYICYWVIERPLNAFCQYLLIKRAP
ncbi:acyltransferase family protein [Wohlfahrtiimonas chitiniclastica]|uniref:acyltransferase family protein n=1 Tax=Wohlfahrtiimonas chitiniclastica TaxID=400946 RepID=UPI001BCF62F3|nr:acyltransferase [Wohlfahrtiimonas chitiniclastica]MBS7816120.1 acyltransferase [Wohlfahrtiimonas chitiniclastica]MBS7821885.1 acyltransferase [Wohlfahrtiimonas chitiniclastica]MBS7829677.1 acyltransferase [Wohlfahrtiimonas chitiniclastica]MBS7831644.1 acyltransferase [Wohlfahrtiimonas chitiniclastica]